MKTIRARLFGDQLRYMGNEPFVLRLPGHPEMLKVQVRDNQPWLYTLEMPVFPERMHWFLVLGDDEILPDALGNYVDSFQVNMGTKRAPDLQTFHLFVTHHEVGAVEEDDRLTAPSTGYVPGKDRHVAPGS